MASPFMDVLEKMLDENEDDHDNLLSDDEQSMDEDQSGDAGECTDGSDQDYRNLIVQSDIDFPDDDDQSDQDAWKSWWESSQWKWGPVLWLWWRLSLFWTALCF